MHPSQSSTTPAPVSRAGFLRRGARVLGAGGIGAALASGPAAAEPSADDEPADHPHGLGDRAGITTRFRMDATDLGAPALTPDGRILAIFGDTVEQPAVGGSWWRSPVGLFADADRPLTAGIRWTSTVGGVGGEVAEQLVDDAHDSAPVSTILPGDHLGGHVGEMCLPPVEDRWVLTWFNAGLYRVDVHVADSPTGLAAPAFTETLLWGGIWGQEDDVRVAQLYGPYILPGSTLDEMHLLCSQWNTGAGWPYHVQQFRVHGRGRAMRSIGA